MDGISDLVAYEAGLCPGDHVLMGLVTSEVPDIDELIDHAATIPVLERVQ